MVAATYLDTYKELLHRGVLVFDKLLALYAPDKQRDKDWADVSLSDTRNQQRSFAERLAKSSIKITAEEASSVALSVRRYMDEHWADYQEFPVADAQKCAYLQELHAQLREVANGIGQIYNALRNSQ